ncbi:uncharacterized protein IUM83_02989 [Phytophthora cinnamomi]|uniref:uncharacterized protein n=1 Tax=Phytophthora cinnamomi TaxID=4785 RepID=UPI00355A9F5D|nr:hypothetical protein IUM83_02989 [Phytophthora cinnamomi]
MLVEYIEVAMPTILGIHQLVLFHMPNSAYYPQLANLSSTQFYMKFSNVMAYASLELLSLMLATVVLNRTMKLMGVFIYVMQVSLKHVGADFSFKFAWVHSAKTD